MNPDPRTIPIVATASAGTQATGRPDHATLVAELESLTDGASDKEAAPAPTEEARPPVEAAPEQKPKDEPPAEAAPADDPETAKRIARVQKQEEQMRQRIAKEKADAMAELEAKRAELAELVELAKRIEGMKARARYEPERILEELVGEDLDPAYVSKRFFARTKEAQQKPELVGEVGRALKEREAEDRFARLERELAETRQQLVAREQQQQFARDQAQYLDATLKAANESTPLLSQMASKNPERARAALWQTAEAILSETGDLPDMAELAEAFEQRQRAELEALGLDVATVTKKKPGAAIATGRPAAALPAAPSGATPVPSKPTREELIAQTLRDLETGNISVD